MIEFATTILQFAEQGEKTGWTYILIPSTLALKLKPGNKKTFRVKGKLDNYPVKAIALLPMGEGDFIMALNAAMRKGIGKRKGARINVQLEVDSEPIKIYAPLLECLEDEPGAKAFFQTLPPSHQLYFSKWIESAKTEPTRIKRLTQAVTALSRKQPFNIMLRSLQGKL